MTCLFELNDVKENFSYFTIILPLDFSEIFIIVRIRMSSFFFENSGNFFLNLNLM